MIPHLPTAGRCGAPGGTGALKVPGIRHSYGHELGSSSRAVIYVTIAANVLFFSVLGGALLTRYLLPLYPLVLLLCVSTFRRRLKEWTGLVALSAAAFVAGLFVNPPYRFAPEDNLEYATVIHLHQAAIGQIVAQMPGRRC